MRRVIGGVPTLRYHVEQVEEVNQGTDVSPPGDQVPNVGGGKKVPVVPPVMANGILERLSIPYPKL